MYVWFYKAKSWSLGLIHQELNAFMACDILRSIFICVQVAPCP